CAAGGGVARPVAARVIGAVGEGGSIQLRSGEDVVLVRRIADALDRLAFFSQCGDLREIVAAPGHFERVAVQVGHALRDPSVLRVVPRTSADAIARVDGGLSARRARAQIRAPRAVVAGAGGGRELLAVTIGAGEAAEIRALADADAGDE